MAALATVIALLFNGLSWTLPAGWHEVGPHVNALANPAPRLAAASFPVRPVRRDPNCGVENVRAQLPAEGAFVLLLEVRGPAGRLPRARVPFGPVRSHECFGRASVVHWTERGRSFLAVGLFGPAASRAQADALLDSLVVES
jgi:hypothetical protein